jgi:DNA replication protein DnaC
MSVDVPEMVRRAKKLALHGLCAHIDEVAQQEWVDWLLRVEEQERRRRSLERRLRFAAIGRFKPMADFDWSWPTEIDREAVEELFTFGFMSEKANVVLVGPNGVGKSMISKNLAYQALLRGHRVLFTTASAMLNALAAQDGSLALQRKLKYYCGPELLVIDELGYLSYDNRHADLLFEVVTRRYEVASTVVTTNKAFAEWNQVFPNAACVVTLVDRLVHRAEILTIDGESYRLKEANERKAKQTAKRRRGIKEPTA